MDFERAELLFDIVESAAKHGALYSAIAKAASAELKEMNDEATAEQQAEAKAEAEEKAKAATAESKRIFPQGSGVREGDDPPAVQRKV